MEPARHQRRSGSMPRVWAMAVAILALSACTPIVGSSQLSPTTPPPSTKVHLATLGTPGCQPGAFRVSETGFPEVGSDSSRGSFWALFFTPVPPPAGKDIKVVWRMTGSGDFKFRASDSGGEVIGTVGNPQPHGVNGSNWNHPGFEVGTGFNFPHSGCWDVHVARSNVDGDLWLEVASLVAASF